MATVILCDKCEKKIYGKPHRWNLAGTQHVFENEVDLCEGCWNQLSRMVWDKVYERLKQQDSEKD